MIDKTVNRTKYKYRKDTLLPNGYLEKLVQKRYSKNTINTYSTYFKDFINEFKNQNITSLSKNILILLRKYYKNYKPKKWLFESPKKY